MLRSYRLWAVLGLGGGGKARGVSSLNGESPTLRGLLGTHVQAPGRSLCVGRGEAVRLLSDRAPTQSLPPGLLLTCRRPRPVPGWKQLPEPWLPGGRSGPGAAGQVSAVRVGPGVEGEGCIVTRALAC